MGKRDEGAVVGAVIARPKRSWARDIGALQQIARAFQQRDLVRQLEFADILTAALADRGSLGPGQPLGVGMKLHLMATFEDRTDDVRHDPLAIDECGQRIDEEHPLQALLFQPVHLPADPDRAGANDSEDRILDIAPRRDATLVQRGG